MTTVREAAQMALDALKESKKHITDQRRDKTMEALRAALAQQEQEPVGNTLTFMTRAIFNIVADHQEINGGYFIADGDVAAFVDRLAKVINSTFEPLKHKNPASPQQPEQEPYCYTWDKWISGGNWQAQYGWEPYCGGKRPDHSTEAKPLYTAPPQREWQGLTDEELAPIYAEYKSPRNIYLAIESALREKNT